MGDSQFCCVHLSLQDVYDAEFVGHVLSLPTLPGPPAGGESLAEFQVHYSGNKGFEQLAKQFQIMSDIRVSG